MRANVAVLAALSLAACGTAPPASTTVSTAPPPGLSVALKQGRSDPPKHLLTIAMTNTNPTPVHLLDVQLVTDSFATLPAERMDTTIRKVRVALRIPYGEARCITKGIPPVKPATVIATIREADGAHRTVKFAVPHPDRLLTQLVNDECAAHLVKQEVDIGFGADADWQEDGRIMRGVLVLTRRGTGDRAVTVQDASGSTHYILDPASGDRRPVADLAPGRPELRIPLEVTPGRCDAHAFADAKQANLFPVWITVGDDKERAIIVTPVTSVQNRLLTYAHKYCGT